jgi:hypothetical protein
MMDDDGGECSMLNVERWKNNSENADHVCFVIIRAHAQFFCCSKSTLASLRHLLQCTGYPSAL